MKIALISDIHANVTALKAILRDIKHQGADRILSLGDQVNLGPCPRETLDLLSQEHVACLIGNHERYVLEAMDGKSGYEGANFDLVRFTASQVTRNDLLLPETSVLGPVLFCHALPGKDSFPVYDPDRVQKLLPDCSFGRYSHIVCGHGHNPTQITFNGIQIDSIGSSGCMDAGIPGAAMYSMLWLYENGITVIRPRFVTYDVHEVMRQFIQKGLFESCPILSRIICQQMTDNLSVLVPFVALASQLAKEAGESHITPEIFGRADEQFDWADGLRSAEYWEKVIRELRSCSIDV